MRRPGIVASSIAIASLTVAPASAQSAGGDAAVRLAVGPRAPMALLPLRKGDAPATPIAPAPGPGPMVFAPLSPAPTRLTGYLDAQAKEALREGLLAVGPEQREHHFQDAEDHARSALTLDPGDLEARYYLAASLGLLTEHAGLHDQIRLGREAYDQAMAILAVDPNHAGAHHIIGRLNAEIMRMGGMARFVVGRLLGSDLVRQASWEAAEAHLEAAVEAEPDHALHHVELARVYADTHRPELARQQIDMVFRRADEDPLGPMVATEARTLLAMIDRQN